MDYSYFQNDQTHLRYRRRREFARDRGEDGRRHVDAAAVRPDGPPEPAELRGGGLARRGDERDSGGSDIHFQCAKLIPGLSVRLRRIHGPEP